MKKLIYSSIMFCLVGLLACEEQEKFGLAQADTGFNFRMIPDNYFFNIADDNPEINFSLYSETENVKNVEVSMELYTFLDDHTTERVKIADIAGGPLDENGTTKLGFTLQDFADAVGVDPAILGGGDVFTLYNVVELEDGRIYPDTLKFGDDEFLNMENSFITAGNTTSFTGKINLPMVCPVASPFTGNYTIVDDCGEWAGTASVSAVPGNPTQREFAATWESFGGIGFAFDLTCGRIFVANQSIGLGCGGGSNVDVVTSDIDVYGPGSYDDLDDSEFVINVYYSNGDCYGDFDCQLVFTKQ